MGLLRDDWGYPTLFGSILIAFGMVGLLTAVALLLIFGCCCIRWSTGEKIYTGYIYSADDQLGDSTVGHIRFSEYAVEDEQPSFCVKKENGQQIKELAGSGKKVRVTVSTGFAIAVPWNCPIPATVEVVE